MTFTTRTVTATYKRADNVSPASGWVTFTPNTTLQAALQSAMYPAEPVRATLDATGHISVTLICTDSTDVSPSGWAYTVAEQIAGAYRSYSVFIASGAGSLDLSGVAPLQPAPASVLYVLSSAVGQVGGTAGPLDGSGLIPAAQIPLAPTAITIAADGSAISSTTLANISGLGIAVGIGSYEFEFVIPYTGSVTGASGSAPNINLTGPATSFVSYVIDIQTGVSSFNEYMRTALNSAQQPGTGVGNTTVTYLCRIRGRVTTTAGGTLQPQLALGTSPFTGTVTIKAGAYGKVQPF
jgi:hypothetical protein